MIVHLRFFKRKKNYEPDFYSPIYTHVIGETPSECSKKIKDMRFDHDVNRYTPIQIIDLED